MTRPTTMLGLVARLAALYPFTAVIAVALGVLAIVAAHARPSTKRSVEACAFEQTWYQGDIHFSQELVFESSGAGRWSTGGMSDDAPQKRVSFQWARTDTTLTAKVAGESRTVRYELRRHGTHCFLTFETSFLDAQQATHYSDSP